MDMLYIGMKGQIEKLVTKQDTAISFGSGGVEVFATPMMIGIMENAAMNGVDTHLPRGYATVGVHLDVKHLAATPIGMKVRAEAELIEIVGKKLKFKITAFDEKEIIGEGTHSRYVIELEKFMESVNQKNDRC